MGASASQLVDELHSSAQLPDEISVERKLKVLKTVQEMGAADPEIAVQVVEQGGMQPLLRSYNASHPRVRTEAAKALAVLSRQPTNQLEMGQDDTLPHYHPALLTGDPEFKEHAMAIMAELATPEVNKLKLAHEGLLGPIIAETVSPSTALQLHALRALARLCEVPQIAGLAAQRSVLDSLLKAARSPDPALKLAVIKVLTGLAAVGQNLSAFVSSGALIFLLGCTFNAPDVQVPLLPPPPLPARSALRAPTSPLPHSPCCSRPQAGCSVSSSKGRRRAKGRRLASWLARGAAACLRPRHSHALATARAFSDIV